MTKSVYLPVKEQQFELQPIFKCKVLPFCPFSHGCCLYFQELKTHTTPRLGFQDGLHHRQDPVQNENVKPLVQKQEFQDGSSTA